MTITRSWAQRTLLYYLIMGLPGPLALLYLPNHFVVAHDAAATAQRIVDGLFTYRLIVLADLASPIGFVLLAWSLYHLFEEVDRRQAQLLVTFVVICAVLQVVDVAVLLAPLAIQSGADYLTAFTKPQLDALTLGTVRLRDVLLQIDEAFWGLWLLPFGILVIKSGAIPKIIGAFLLLGGFAWLTLSATAIAFPDAHTVQRLVFPLVQPGEISIVLWLLYKSLIPAAPKRRVAFAG
jgi:hypothetical protein